MWPDRALAAQSPRRAASLARRRPTVGCIETAGRTRPRRPSTCRAATARRSTQKPAPAICVVMSRARSTPGTELAEPTGAVRQRRRDWCARATPSSSTTWAPRPARSVDGGSPGASRPAARRAVGRVRPAHDSTPDRRLNDDYPVVEERGLVPAGFYGWGQVAPAGRLHPGHPRPDREPGRPRRSVDAVLPLVGQPAARDAAVRRPGSRPAAGHGQRGGDGRTADLSLHGARRRVPPIALRLGGALSDWVTSWLRWQGGAAFDRIGTIPRLALEGSLNARAFGDRFAARSPRPATGSAPAASVRFGTRELVATLRSTATQDVPVFTTLVGIARSTDAAPLAAWPAASGPEGRGAFLRAHPLRSDSVVTGEVFGRTLLFSTTEYRVPVPHPFRDDGSGRFRRRRPRRHAGSTRTPRRTTSTSAPACA